jgi:hypothetical protein
MATASKLPLNIAELAPNLRVPGVTPPPRQAAGMMAGPGGTPLGTFPSPTAPAEPPYTVDMQADGSAIFKSRTEPPVVIGVAKAPKLPPALQPPKM